MLQKFKIIDNSQNSPYIKRAEKQVSARERAIQYAKKVKKPNKSNELSEIIQERKNNSLEKSGGTDRLDLDLIKIKRQEQINKQLVPYQYHPSVIATFN